MGLIKHWASLEWLATGRTAMCREVWSFPLWNGWRVGVVHVGDQFFAGTFRDSKN